MGKATYTVTVTNNSNGVSVDYETETPMTLLVPEVAAEVIKDLVNTVRSYDTMLVTNLALPMLCYAFYQRLTR